MSSATIKTHSINVRSLAEFAFERGDLSRQTNLADRMQDGIKGHKTLQQSYPQGYRSEVAVRLETQVLNIRLIISGRIDGLYLEPGKLAIVDEIKTTRRPVGTIAIDDYPEHWAQAEIYAYMLCQTHNLDSASIVLSYYNLSGALQQFRREFDQGELYERFTAYAEPYARWLAAVDAYLERSLPTISALKFPFDTFRTGQREMAANAYTAIRERVNLLCEAPTGTGKTAAALFPALKALGEGLIERAFYLTARTTTRQVAERTIENMRQLGLVLRSVTLTSKEKLCLMPGEKCSPDTCDHARGYYDRRRDALTEALGMTRFTRERIESLAAKHCLCPFELSLDLCEIADVIICDYNHAFDPKVRLRRFFLDGGDYALIIDEAHNLIDRSRDMLSSTIDSREFVKLRRDVGKALGRKGPLYSSIKPLIKALEDARSGMDEPFMLAEPPPALTDPLVRFCESWQPALEDGIPGVNVADAYFAALDYLRTLERYDECYRTLIEPHGKGAAVKLWCYNSAPHLKKSLDSVRGAVMFSATLSPIEYYFSALGMNEDAGDAMLRLASPFPPENLLVMNLPVQTRFSMRERTLGDVAGAILGMCRAKKGNYIACFPSHAYLNSVRESLEAAGEVDLLVQRSGMNDNERAQFLGEFEQERERSLLALIAMGGIFSEGIDLPGELLIGAAVLGVGIPQLSFEREQLRELFDEDGYHYAYTYPGLERVLQAAGRVIRSETDRGVVLLIDDRFRQGLYRSLMPPHWRIKWLASTSDLTAHLKSFW